METTNMDIILASGSPRRKQLLEMLGFGSENPQTNNINPVSYNLIVIPADIDENAYTGLQPVELVKTLSYKKARLIANKHSGDYLVIAADTVVALDGEILGKPRDTAHAAEILNKLSGKQHSVYTGVTVIHSFGADNNDNICITEAEETIVTFREILPREIEAYINTGEPMDKAGAYGAQGIGALFISKISGDFFNVMGLPICLLGNILSKTGVNVL